MHAWAAYMGQQMRHLWMWGFYRDLGSGLKSMCECGIYLHCVSEDWETSLTAWAIKEKQPRAAD